MLAFCWAHQRRDYLELANAHPHLVRRAFAWVNAIGELYRLNDLRPQAKDDSAERAERHAHLQQAVQRMSVELDAALADPARNKLAAKVLQSIKHYWSGLTVFVERGRKNFYGSGSKWSGQLAAAMYSVLMTVKLWGLNARTWLSAYLQARADNGNQAPPHNDAFLP